jgi:hypothetical protein
MSSLTHEIITHMGGRHIERYDLEETWEQMNALLGNKVLAIAPWEIHSWQKGVYPEGPFFEREGRELYILTPEEIVRWGVYEWNDLPAIPDPRNKDFVREIDPSLEANPAYCLAYPGRDFGCGMSANFEIATMRSSQSWDPPMHRIGDHLGIPVICYHWYSHSGRGIGFHGTHAMLRTVLDRLDEMQVAPED